MPKMEIKYMTYALKFYLCIHLLQIWPTHTDIACSAGGPDEVGCIQSSAHVIIHNTSSLFELIDFICKYSKYDADQEAPSAFFVSPVTPLRLVPGGPIRLESQADHTTAATHDHVKLWEKTSLYFCINMI